MTASRYAARALALSLSLTAVGVFYVVGAAAAPAHATAGDPVGGQQLAAPGVIVNLTPGVPAPPAMPGASYLIADMDTGEILAAKAPHTPHLPASTLKTLTALTLIPVLDVNAKILVQPQDVNVQGTHLGILAGTEYTAGTLLEGMLMASGNDSAYALARANHGITQTLAAMNATAAELGAFDTVAKDPSGLDKAGQTSSAYDLALIGRAAMKLPDFRRYVKTKQASLPGGRSADGKLMPGFKIGNHNKLLYNYQGAIGIKNGYTVAAKYTYVEAATRGGRTYLLTEMDSPKSSWRPTAALLDWAFAYGSALTPIGDLVEPGTATRPARVAASDTLPQAPTTTAPSRAPSQALRQAPRVTPGTSAGLPALPAWAGVTALIVGLALVAAWVRRNTLRRRTRRRIRSRA